MEKFSIRKSDFDRFVERLGADPGEVARALKAEAARAGSGYRYIIDMENFFFFVLEGVLQRRRKVTEEAFEDTLDRAVERAAGLSGYASLAEVKRAVIHELGISEGEFVERLAALLQKKKGRYILLEGGDVKIQIGQKKFGYIKKIEPNNISGISL
ncbi:MAG: hypothetical protein ACK4SY_04085 [Pyrobaculum sp.]